MPELNHRNYSRSRRNSINTVMFFIVFLVGFLNTEDYLNFMGLNELNVAIRYTLYVLIILVYFSLLIKNLMRRKVLSINLSPYWLVLVIGVLLKFFILLLQNPSWLLYGGQHYSQLIIWTLNFLTMILIINTTKNFGTTKLLIWALGLGSLFSVLIPLLFFPDMIGSRITEVQGFTFTGAFWNSAVVSFISVGWLLVSLSSIEDAKIKRIVLISLFFLMVFGGVAGLSRAILLSILVSLIVYLFVSKKLTKYLKVIVSSTLLIILVIKLFPDLFLSLSERLDRGVDIKDEARIDIWLDYLEGLPNYLLFGEIDGDYKKYSNGGYGPHSVILNWLVQYGILALIGFIILLVEILKSIGKIKYHYSKEVSATLYAWIASYLSVALVNETGFNQLTIFTAFGIVLGWGKISGKLGKE